MFSTLNLFNSWVILQDSNWYQDWFATASNFCRFSVSIQVTTTCLCIESLLQQKKMPQGQLTGDLSRWSYLQKDLEMKVLWHLKNRTDWKIFSAHIPLSFLLLLKKIAESLVSAVKKTTEHFTVKTFWTKFSPQRLYLLVKCVTLLLPILYLCFLRRLAWGSK